MPGWSSVHNLKCATVCQPQLCHYSCLFPKEQQPYLQIHLAVGQHAAAISVWVSCCADGVKSDLLWAVLESANPALLCCSGTPLRGQTMSFKISLVKYTNTEGLPANRNVTASKNDQTRLRGNENTFNTFHSGKEQHRSFSAELFLANDI